MKKVSQNYLYHRSFTLLELVFVIVIIGVLATFVLSQNKRNLPYEAATQLISDIRYTQHLAMIDDKFSASDDNWYKMRWSIRFNKDLYSDSKEAYTIFADTAGTSAGSANFSEIALNPQNSDMVLSGGITGESKLNIGDDDAFKGTRKMNLGLSYGITSVAMSGGCNSKNISFDHLGRPIDGRLNDYISSYETGVLIQTRCSITLDSSDGSVVIAIEPETGYVHIL